MTEDVSESIGYFYSPSVRGFFHSAIHGETMPSDAVPVTDEEHAALMAAQATGKEITPGEDGRPVSVAKVPTSMEEWRAFAASTVQGLLNDTARQRQYDSMQTAVSYRGDPNPAYAAEAEALFSWRSSVWTAVFTILADVEAGEREMPTPADFLTELPPMVWPEAA